MVDFHKGQDRGGRTDKNFFSFADRKVRSFFGGMFSAQSTVGAALEYSDVNLAKPTAKAVSRALPPSAAINSALTIGRGVDMHGDVQSGIVNRFVKPTIGLASSIATFVSDPFQGTGNAVINAINRIDNFSTTKDVYNDFAR